MTISCNGLLRYTLRDDLIVPIAYKNHVRVSWPAKMPVHDGLSISYRTAVDPYTALDQTRTHLQQ